MKKIENNKVLKLSIEFALEIIKYSELLEEQRKYIIARQLLKSGTSIGANIREAQNAESKADILHKFKIAAKEAGETEYWLTLCKFSPGYPSPETLLINNDALITIISKIIISTKVSIQAKSEQRS